MNSWNFAGPEHTVEKLGFSFKKIKKKVELELFENNSIENLGV